MNDINFRPILIMLVFKSTDWNYICKYGIFLVRDYKNKDKIKN
jgi:hypothetical protein